MFTAFKVSKSALKFVSLLLYSVTLVGCYGAGRDTVNVNDNATTLVAASVTLHPDSLRGHSKRGQGGIELGYEGTSGTDTHWIYPGSYITFDQHLPTAPYTRIDLNGLDHVNYALRLDHGHAAYSYIFNVSRHFSVEPSAGIAYDRFNIKVASLLNGATLQTTQGNFGFTVGVVPRINFNEYFGLEGRIRLGFDTRGGSTVLFNPALACTIKNISFSAGYVTREQHLATTGYGSPVNLSFYGPSVALRMKF